jgi:hypothetical protein
MDMKSVLGATLSGALVLQPFSSAGTNHILRMDEVMAGLNGDPTIQFIEITVENDLQKAWGPDSRGNSRAMLVFSNGDRTDAFFFPGNAPGGGNRVLIATTNFAALPGAPVPDFLIPPLISPGSGQVCFRGNPASREAFSVFLCLSYGDFPTGGGEPAAPALPISGDPTSLARFQNFAFRGSSGNGNFRLASPTPVNTRGQGMSFPVDGPEIGLAPPTVNFGAQEIKAGAVSRVLVITNDGRLNPLTITNVALVGVESNEFVITADTGETNLPPRRGRTIRIAFDPETAGSKSALVRVVSNDTNEMVTSAALVGFGTDLEAAEISFSPEALFFGAHNVARGPSIPQTMFVFNEGTADVLILTDLSITGADANRFRIIGPTNGITVPPQDLVEINVVFDPDHAGLHGAVLRIVSNDIDEQVIEISLDGRGFDLDPCVAPDPLNTVPQDDCKDAQPVGPGMLVSGVVGSFSATADGEDGEFDQLPDVWFRYVPGGDGLAVAFVNTSAGVIAMSAHSGCPGTAANKLTLDHGNTFVSFLATNGVEVFIRVASEAAAFEFGVSGPASMDFDLNRNGITDACEWDFGDAPAPYATTLAANGARHKAFTGVFLGKRIDPEGDGQPSASATGDNEAGNDEEGVTFLSPLTAGQTASVRILASTNGFLNAWIDFNADGDWTDTGEQIFTNEPLVEGTNVLTLAVSSDATARTFARFRFSSTAGLSFVGASADGEVEDYAVEILPASRTPGAVAVRFNATMAGLNGDSSIQFVELEADGDANKLWGPQGGEIEGRAMLVFFDATGAQSGRFVFPSNAPSGANTVLVATREFAHASGIRPDFIMPPEIVAIGGKVVFRSNPDNEHFNFQIALSYGGSTYFGTTDGGGAANPNELPIMHAQSLRRVREMPFGLNDNGAFELGPATARNTAGQSFSFAPASAEEQGRTLFTRETFRGNGRTCATCHVPGKDQFGLTPSTISELPEDDPLFVFAPNVNTLKLTARSRPSDLRGEVTGGGGHGKILSGSGDTYLVIGGTNLSGTITDASGNAGTVEMVMLGDLSGPNPINGSARGLEDHELLDHGRALILENIDGFARREVFRASPHLLNLAFTAPFGLSGEFDNLEDFSDGAVMQHFPKSLQRRSGVDFRHPTREELEAMTAFMVGISKPSTNALNLDRLATTEAQKRGRAMFFGDEGKCFKCHSGPVLALSDGSLFESISNRNDNFDTGVANLAINLPSGHDLPPETSPVDSTGRKFNTPSLFNVRLTAPFFHEGSAETLAEAVHFYDTPEFLNSPPGQEIGSLLAANRPEKVADMVAFLECLIEPPLDFTRELRFGIRCPGEALPEPMTATITNISSSQVTITNVVINGTNAADFTIVSDSGEAELAPGAMRRIVVGFSPTTMGMKNATLEIEATDTNFPGSLSFGVALNGADVDNFVQVSPTALDFGTRHIAGPASPASITITNNGSIDLPITVEVAGATPLDFTVAAQPSVIPAHGNGVIALNFGPRGRGPKSAVVRIGTVACNGTWFEIPLSGNATSMVHHFVFDSVAPTQYVGTPFPVRVTAKDPNGETIESFGDIVNLVGVTFEGVDPEEVAVSPPLSGQFSNGVWVGFITVQEPAQDMVVIASINRLPPGGSSERCVTLLRDDLWVNVAERFESGLRGYSLRIGNTGTAEATGVMVTNNLPPGVFISGSTTHGVLSHVNGVVTCNVGTLAAAAEARIEIAFEPSPPPPPGMVTNIARVSRHGPEAVLSNNVAITIVHVEPFAVLTVTPQSEFQFHGAVGGPFAPSTQIYTISNAGTRPLNWTAAPRECMTPVPGIAGWWPMDGSLADMRGSNSGIMAGGAAFTNGIAGDALQFDGRDDAVRILSSPELDVGTGDGLTVGAWILPLDISRQRPVVQWASDSGVLGVQLGIALRMGDGTGGHASFFADFVDTGGISHRIASPPGFFNQSWHHLAATYDKATGKAVLYINGSIAAEKELGTFTPRTALDVVIGGAVGTQRPFFGVIDEVIIHGRALSQPEVHRTLQVEPRNCRGDTPMVMNCPRPAELVHWWPFDREEGVGFWRDIIGDRNASDWFWRGTVTNGLVGNALFFSGGAIVIHSPELELDLGSRDGFSFEGWVKVPNPGRPNPIFGWFNGPSLRMGGDDTPAALHADLIETNDASHPVTSPVNILEADTWTHVALTYNKADGRTRLYVNGAMVEEQILGPLTLRTTRELFLGRAPRSGAVESPELEGLLDEPSLYARELTEAEIRSVFLAGDLGKCRNLLWMQLSATSGTLEPGESTTVTVSLNGVADELPAGHYVDAIAFNAWNGWGAVLNGNTERVASLTVLGSPVIQSLARAGGNLVLRWQAVRGVHYVVEVNDDLDPQGWTEVPGEVVASQRTAAKEIPFEATIHRFYRIRLVR